MTLRKLFVGLLTVVAGGIISGIVGLIIGAFFGGNFAENLSFNGVRGYEAAGQLGLIFGAIGGGALVWLIVFKRFKNR